MVLHSKVRLEVDRSRWVEVVNIERGERGVNSEEGEILNSESKAILGIMEVIYWFCNQHRRRKGKGQCQLGEVRGRSHVPQPGLESSKGVTCELRGSQGGRSQKQLNKARGEEAINYMDLVRVEAKNGAQSR